MKAQLIQLLKLSPAPGNAEVSDDQIINAVTALQAAQTAAEAKAAHDKEVNDLIRESCGALSRNSAEDILADRKRRAEDSAKRTIQNGHPI